MDQAVMKLLLVAMPSMDNSGIAKFQRGDQSWGVQILGTDVASGQGGADTTSAPSKSTGKAMWIIHNDDEVSSDDDIPLQW
jgi:hypothetical protein